MNQFPYYDNPYQSQSSSTNNQLLPSQPYQISSPPFYYQNESHSLSYSNHATSFNTSPMYNNNNGFQAQVPVHREMTTFIPPSPKRNNTRLETNKSNQSFEKTDSEIQTNNQLYKQGYLKLLKQRTAIQDKLHEIKNIKDFKLKIASFDNLAQTKPTLQVARLVRDRIHQANDQTEFTDLNLIVQDIEACEEVTRKIHDFLAKYDSKVKNFSEANSQQAREVGSITRGFNELKKEIRGLILKDVDILHEWEIFEWYLMVKLELIKEPGSLQLCDIEHWNELKKFAPSAEIMGSQQYEKVCQQINAYELIKEICQELQKQENLILQNKGNKEEIIEIRKRLMKKTEVEGLLKEIQGCYVRASKERAYIKELLERTRTATNLYEQRKSKQKKLSLGQLYQFSRLFERLPMQMLEEEEINGERLKAENIIKSFENNVHLLRPNVNLRFAQTIHEQYQNCLVEIPYARWISDIYLKNKHYFEMPEEKIVAVQQQNKDSSSLLVKRKEPHETREEKRSKLSTTGKSDREVSDSSSDEGSPKEKGKKKMGLFESKKKIKHAGNSMEPRLRIEVSDYRREKASAQILKALLRIRDFPKNKDPVLISRGLEENVYNKYLNNRDRFVDHVDSICKFFGDLNDSQEVQEKVFATTMEYEHICEYLEQDDKKSNKLKIIRKTGRMNIENLENLPPPLIIRHQSSKEEKLERKESGLQRQVSKEGGNEEGEKVDKETRENTREEFEDLVKSLEGHEVLKDVKEVVMELEKKVDARYFMNKGNYEKRAYSICNFLMELRGYPCLRRKVLKQNIEYGEIRNYLDTALERFDTQAYEEERNQNQNQKIEVDNMESEFDDLFAKKEEYVASGQETLPVWAPQVDFKLPEILEVTIPDEKVVMAVEEEKKTEEPERIELEDENKENIQRHANCENEDGNQENIQRSANCENEKQEISLDLKKTDSSINLTSSPERLSAIEKENQKDHSPKDDKRKKDQKTKLSIKRVFFGKLRQKISHSYSDSLPCSFDTYASSDKVSRFPRMLNGVPHFDTALASPFLHDLNKSVHSKKNSSFRRVLVGWVSAPSFASDLFTSILQFLIEKKSVGVYSYLFGAEVYLVPSKLVDGRYEELKKTLNWVCLDPEEAPAPEKQLLFAICLTDKYETRSYTKMMKAKKMLPGRSSRVTAEINEVDQDDGLELEGKDQEEEEEEEGEVLADHVLKHRKKQLEIAKISANEGV